VKSVAKNLNHRTENCLKNDIKKCLAVLQAISMMARQYLQDANMVILVGAPML